MSQNYSLIFTSFGAFPFSSIVKGNVLDLVSTPIVKSYFVVSGYFPSTMRCNKVVLPQQASPIIITLNYLSNGLVEGKRAA